MLVSRTVLGIAAGICGTLFVGYCIYFDHQRRSDPDFKKKLRARRRANKVLKNANKTQFPDFTDQEAVQEFFMKQVQLGEDLLSQGDLYGGVEHMSNAVAVCGQPMQLIRVLEQTLPPRIFQMLLEKIPSISERIAQNPCGQMVEEDVE